MIVLPAALAKYVLQYTINVCAHSLKPWLRAKYNYFEIKTLKLFHVLFHV